MRQLMLVALVVSLPAPALADGWRKQVGRAIDEAREAAEVLDDADRGCRKKTSGLLDAYVEHVLTFVDVASMRPLKVAADTANGMGGLVVPAVMARLPVTLHHLYAELDGTFPNHPADPIDPENQRDLKAAVREHGCDVGLAFDGDADRVFLVDDKGADRPGKPPQSFAGVQSALRLACAAPTARPFILAEHHCTRAGPAANAGVALVVKRVVGDVFVGDPLPDVLLGPVGQRTDLHQAELLVPADAAEQFVDGRHGCARTRRAVSS